MKLLHVVSGMDPALGGVCQAVRTIIVGLSDLEVHSEVVSLDEPDAHFLGGSAFAIHALGPSKGPWSYSRELLPWLMQNFRRFDAVIIHGLWLYPSYAASKALRDLSKLDSAGNPSSALLPKLFVMPHGMLDPYFQRAKGRKVKALRNWAYWKLIEGQVINEADGVLFTCEDEQRLALEPFRPYKPKRTVVVGLGVVDPPPYTDAMREAFLAHCPELTHQPYFLFISRIHEKKGVDLLLGAYATLADKQEKAQAVFSTAPHLLPEDQTPKLLIAGPGLETVYGQRQQSITAALALRTRVSFPGMLSGAAKWGAFYGCEAFVLPSHQENFGIAVVEALACSKPVLISNQVNIWREIEAVGGGIIANDTLEGTQTLLNQWQKLSYEEKVEMRKQARVCFLNNFNIDTVARRYMKALFEI